jgi:tetratricopeptide (TPR) repeat protein
MNKLKYIFLLLLLIHSISSKSQDIKINEIEPFIQIEQGEYNSALILLDELINKNPSLELLMAKVDVLIKLEQFNEALLICDKIDNISSSSVQRIKIYQELGKLDELGREIIKNQNSRYRISLYDYLTNEDYFIAREIALEKNDYTSAEKQHYQARVLLENKKYSQALFIIDEIIARDTKDSEAYFLQSKIAFNLQDYKKANYAIEKALDLNTLKTEYYRQKVCSNLKLGNYTIALETVNKLIRKDLYNINSFILKLEVLLANDMFNESSVLSNSLLQLIPENKEVLIANGKSLYKTGDYLGALKSTNHLLEVEKSKKGFELRGDIYMATSTYKYAEYDYSMSLDINPYNGDVYAKKGFARYKHGNQKGACSDWEKAIRYGSYQAVKYKEQYCK